MSDGRCSFHRASTMAVSADELGRWHFRAGAIHRLIPPWESIRVLREAAPLVNGARAEIRIRKGPVATTLVALHGEVDAPRQFVDTQERGPFGSWRHVHRFLPESADRSAEAFDTESLVDAGVEHDAERIVNFPRAERLRAGPVHARAPQPIPAPGRRKPKPGSASEPPTNLYRSQRNDLVVDVIIDGLVSLLLRRRRVEKEQHFEIHFGLERSPRNDPGEPETEPQNEP